MWEMGPNRKDRRVAALLIRHQVTDFEHWMRAFEEEAATRRANGLQAEQLYRSASNPSEVWILATWDDVFRARLFVKSDDHAAALTRGGVRDLPAYWYLNDANRPP